MGDIEVALINAGRARGVIYVVGKQSAEGKGGTLLSLEQFLFQWDMI